MKIEKKIVWSQKKILSAKANIRRKFFLSLIALFGIVTFAYAVSENSPNTTEIGATGGITYAIAAMASIPTAEPSESKPSLNYKLWVCRVSDEADMDNFPAASGVTLPTIPLKSGKYWHYIDCDQNSINTNAASEGDIAPNLALEVTANVLGLTDAVMSLVHENNGGLFLIAWEHCATGKKFVAGSPCSGMKLSVSKYGSDENFSGATLSFKSACPDPFLRYTGTIQTQTADVVAADATEIPLTTNSAYQLTDNTTATVITSFSGATAADDGRVIDIFGSGGTTPATIIDTGDFLLSGGSTWPGSAGSKLTVQIFKDGASTYKYIELSRC